MSLIEEQYQDADGNWLPEAEEILAKATATQTTNNGKHTLFPLNEVEDFFDLLFEEHADADLRDKKPIPGVAPR